MVVYKIQVIKYGTVLNIAIHLMERSQTSRKHIGEYPKYVKATSQSADHK